MHPDQVFLAGALVGAFAVWYLLDQERRESHLSRRLGTCELALYKLEHPDGAGGDEDAA